jgi:hypothetical protein
MQSDLFCSLFIPINKSAQVNRYGMTLLLLLLFLPPAPSVNAQIDSLAEMINESNPDQNEINELVEEISNNPLEINSATRDELEYFSFLSPAQINTILESRPFANKKDLRGILGRQLYRLFEPFFTVSRRDPPFHLQTIFRWQRVIEKNQGLIDKIYRGSPGSIYTRLRFQYRPMLSGGILTQKDSGESLFYDHYTGFLQWQEASDQYKIILGAYRIQYAQGLVFASPFSTSKGIWPSAFLHTRRIKLSPFLSASEDNGLLGIAGQVNFSRLFQFTCFHSHQSRDATIVNGRIKNITTGGYHRTSQELERKDRVREIIVGGAASICLHPSISLGAFFLNTRYKIASNPPAIFSVPDSAYNAENFLPRQIPCCSFSCNASLAALNFATELSSNKFHKMAQQFVLSYNYHDHEMAFKWWMIPKNYLSPYGHSFASNSSFPQAKNGAYLTAATMPKRNLQICTYWLVEKDLWRTYVNPLPMLQKEFTVQIKYWTGPSIQILCHYHFTEDHHFTSDHLQSYTDYLCRYRLQMEKSFNPCLRIRLRMEKIWLRGSKHLQGINLYHDLDYRLGSAFSLLVRYSSFFMDDYLVRTYEYENDIPGTFSTYSVYNKGNKWYLLIKWRIHHNFLLWFKYRRLYLDGVKCIGSGHDLIPGDHRQELRLQLNWEC